MSPVYDTPALLRWNQLKFPAEKGVFYYVYQKSDYRSSSPDGRDYHFGRTHRAVLLHGNKYSDPGLSDFVDDVPVCNAGVLTKNIRKLRKETAQNRISCGPLFCAE